ncbi:hypothetical protein BAR24_14885 [Gluconobacter oxydans]|uniref:TRAFAC clade GTPase domain-containing protein n=1 Tax=Gluconobacter thailandicus TaxID=257438 RepID=UPI000299864C|nr:hypothetical protein [Gluconobacter thailandicus]AFW01774.1 hypothetical protein B932_2212 [Gluconobacter oxydans H24]ANQ42624.1 hypothetical protein BAR24_14885 [Gluconobacter oxydans]
MSSGGILEDPEDVRVADRRVCRLSGCGGPCSGVCINNLSFDECPDVLDAVAPEDDRPQTLSPRPDRDFVVVPGGHALSANACDALLRQRGGTVVGLVAGPEVGKTTLIGLMYELLVRRRMTAFGFAGSDTLRGYDERCYLARTATNAATADTLRTPAKDKLSFTHLRVACGSARWDLVFSDRSGEHFEEVINQPNGIAEFQELWRADVILLLVDLIELLNEPNLQVSRMRRWTMAMAQNGMLEGKVVFLVGTKADVALQTPGSRAAKRELDGLAADLSKRARGVPVLPMIVACRPRKGSTIVGEGVEKLLGDILAPRACPKEKVSEVWPIAPTELDLLMLRYREKLA